MFKFIIYALLFLFTHDSQAMSVYSDNTKAADFFEEEAYLKAADCFTNLEWKGVSYYKAGRYDAAIAFLKKSHSALSLYNLGNAYVKIGDFQKAIKAYEAALIKNPKNKDAAFNLALIKKHLAKQSKAKSLQSKVDNQKKPADPKTQKNQPPIDTKEAQKQNETRSAENEKERMMKQSLDTVPDDPSSLLRKKLLRDNARLEQAGRDY